ncbi:hypothetical protein KOI35_10890 [Actinoplanes bogorensis]|uniref:histidine kinase n=1 Tax=Paractinoplanes bogorensis TaxID=1610840 RepID=A0ABS5YKK4_9ACTN|nr:histidine kinase [Actinoplanes bogorensis]MBU2663995.1 hypothetical protein [Actinoplanes bogorensis]
MTEVERGLSRGVVVAALATAAGFTPGLLGFTDESLPTAAVRSLGWPAFGLVAALLLDRDPRSRLGRALAGMALVPVAVILLGPLVTGDTLTWAHLGRWWQWLGIAPVVVALAVLAWAVDRPADRLARRRLTWLVVCAAALVGALMIASRVGGPQAEAVATMLGMWALAAIVLRLATARELRPVDEPPLDIAIGVATVVTGAGVGTLIRVVAARAGLPGPDLSGGFAAVVTTALALPAGLWLRRRFLRHRYGHGTLTSADVAQITAGLHTRSDPRDLLGQAAAMVATASGHREVRLILGPDAPEVPPHWVLCPLVVGGDRVGTLFFEPSHPEGPEPRQERTVAQLLPTVALVARAVGLAVEAAHAHRDVARQRDVERSRILGDLHDGLGPALAGMSLRVRAERERTPLLDELARELAACRSDLRRVVSGLTPSVLEDGDLAGALRMLAGSFDGNGPAVTLDVRLDRAVPAEAAIAVYRSVAEGLTNAMRHAGAARVGVSVHGEAGGGLAVEVCDDGGGGPIVWGVGLSSLRRRAEELGGRLSVTGGAAGTRLRVELP